MDNIITSNIESSNQMVPSSSITAVDPASLFTDGYELSNGVIQTQESRGSFIPNVNKVEFYIYDTNRNLIISDYDFKEYNVVPSSKGSVIIDKKTGQTAVTTDTINLSPETNVLDRGFNNGSLYAVYNFINRELGSSPTNQYYLAEISSDRTEIRIKSNQISTSEMKNRFYVLQKKISGGSNFDEFYISFGRNEYHIGVNLKLDETVPSAIDDRTEASNIKTKNSYGQNSILIKLLDPLPLKYSLQDQLYVATKPAESQGFLVEFKSLPYVSQDNLITLRGPNQNLKINEFVNDASISKSKNQLLETKSTGSKDQLLNRLSQKGITLNINYSTGSFNDFVNFSSAKARVSNFVEKVSRIHSYESDINVISSTTASNPNVTQISKSLASLYTNIENEIISFDGFEYYQYYTTGSDAYPKTGSIFPLQLQPTSSAVSTTWITSTETSASLYDENNQNWLYYTVPDFIKNNSSNDNYLEFVNMIGQSFDEMWLYTKAITEKNNTTNEFDKGIALELADDVITSLGYTGYGNNYNNQDNFIGLIGNDNGVYVPPTGSELINHYIAVNGPGGIINYWEDFYSFDPQGYVESFRSTGFPYPIDKVSKEIFKRLYHNMSYLVKKKGTVSGLRQLINIWGIPNTILRINEFGGKNKDEENDYDLWYQRYNYAYSPAPAGTNYASSSVRIPWQPLYRNYIHSHNKLLAGNITAVGGPINNGGAILSTTSANYNITTQFTVTGGGTGGTLNLTCVNGDITEITLLAGGSGYTSNSVITITGTQINNLGDTALGSSWSGTSTFPITNANLGAEQIVPDGLGFRFKTTGYPSSSFGGNYTSQSLFIKKSTNASTDADFGIVLNYTGSTSGSHLGSTSSKYVDYGEMRFWIKGTQAGGDTALSPPIYLPFFDKGWWNVQLQRDQHPVVTNNNENTTYTLYVANKIYDGNDGNQIGFQGSASIYVNINNGSPPAIGFPANVNSASLNASWNAFSLDLAQYGAGAYVGGWGNTLVGGSTGSMGILSSERLLPQPLGNKGVQRAGDNFSGSLQEFRYYSHDISQSVFNDAVMNPESIEGNFITGSESSFDIVNFRAPLGNELENLFTSSFVTQYIDQLESMHPAITGSSPLVITASFWNPAFNPAIDSSLTSSYDVTYNANSAGRTYSNTNIETYFLDQPSIGVRNRVSNKIKYSTNLNFGKVLSDQVSIQQDPPVSQSYTDNINLLEVAFSPTEEVNDDIIQTLGYGSIQEVIADPRFRSSSDDTYPGLDAISKDYFKKYTNRNQADYLNLIKYFDDSLFRAIKNYVPARTSVSTGIVIKQHMLERNRYREPQVDIVTTQSYAPFNQPLTTKNLELTGSINTNQLFNPLTQTTFYSSSDPYSFEGGAGGSVNQYNILEEGGSLFVLESDNLSINATKKSIFEATPLEEVSSDLVLINTTPGVNGTALLTFGNQKQFQKTTTGASDVDLEDHAITIITINPADGSTITKKYVPSDLPGISLAGTAQQFIIFEVFHLAGNASTNAISFIAAINSIYGQGSGTSTPTITATEAGGVVTLTQLYGGTDSNTTITYGAKVQNDIGFPKTITVGSGGAGYANPQSVSNSSTTGLTNQSTGLAVEGTLLTANATVALFQTVVNTISNPSGPASNYRVFDTFTVDALANQPPPNNAFGLVFAISPLISITPAAFTGGTANYSTFLSAHKSLRTPIYIDYNFVNVPNVDITIEASSSIRGVVYTNTTNYTQKDPIGSILLDPSGEKQYLDIHPGEDMYVLISSNFIEEIDDYQVILGENIIITNALAINTVTNSPTVLVDTFTEFPVVGSVVTGPDIKGGEVGTISTPTAGTGYTPGTSVLTTTGGGGNNLTLTVTADTNGNVTTAVIADLGTGYIAGNIITIVGGNNDATVTILSATPRIVTITAFDPINNQVTFNTNQTISANSKLVFTSTAIPDPDTIPVSQQGNFNYNVTPLGVDTTWDDTQEQFYDGEYSGSNLSGDQYYNNQYNPYRKVKPNSTGSLYEQIGGVVLNVT